jgi:mannose-6-phosphate isomerase
MSPSFETLTEAARWYGRWLREAALPLWSGAGRDAAQGTFQEALSVEGEPRGELRRARVQARQIWVFARASQAGLGAGYLDLAARGYEVYRARYRRPDDLFVRSADPEGAVADPTPALYEQAFSLLAMAGLQAAGGGDYASDAHRLRHSLEGLRHPVGGFREAGDQPFQANAQMHLFEAALAWEAAGDASWRPLTDELGELALARFIDPELGLLREFFDAEWRPLPEAAGGLIEPGHQFEWAWLLDGWARLRRRGDLAGIVGRLYAAGRRGFDPVREVVVDALSDDLSIRDPRARIWPQTEHLKAAILFGHKDDALQAARGLARYLDTPARGAWRDKMLADGSFVAEPAPATSFYHLLGAILPLLEAAP